ncbi:hypothetical protein SDJN03_28122, partial [Cucurbita argyrosperma subsp. sororia]
MDDEVNSKEGEMVVGNCGDCRAVLCDHHKECMRIDGEAKQEEKEIKYYGTWMVPLPLHLYKPNLSALLSSATHAYTACNFSPPAFGLSDSLLPLASPFFDPSVGWRLNKKR